MQQQAAVKIDSEIGGADTEMTVEGENKAIADEEQKDATEAKFEPYTGKIRKPVRDVYR